MTARDYEHWMDYPKSQVVATAMKLFATAHFEEALPRVLSSFLDLTRPAVSKVAAEVLQRHPFAVPLSDIEAWLAADQIDDRIQQRVLNLVCARGKWEKLPLLLRSLRHTSAMVRSLATKHLKDWMADFNSSGVQPSRANIDSALAELSLSEAHCDRRMAQEFSSLLRSLHV